MTKLLNDGDWKLSMRLSRRGRLNSDALRSLLIHRLSDTPKAVVRRSLRHELHNSLSVFCEACERWVSLPEGAITSEFGCTLCDRRFRVELVVYEQIKPDGGTGDEPVD